MDAPARYAKFQQLKQTIREARNYLLIGVDVAKSKHHACFMRSSGEVVLRRFGFENSRAGFTAFRQKLADYQRSLKPAETVIGLETTGNYLLPLAHDLEAHGFFVVTVSSLVTRRNRDTLDLSWNKTDPKDAWNVTDCLRQGKFLYLPESSSPYPALRRLMHLYARLSVERGRHKVRLQNNILSVVFPEFTQIFAELSELVPRTILEHFPLPRMIAALPQEVFVQRIVGLTDPTIKKAKLRRCHQLATQSIGSAAEADAVVWELRYLLSELTRIRQAQEAILTEVQRLCKNLPGYRLLRTIPGIGPVLAAVLLAEIGDIRTFRSSQQLLKLAGLDLAQIQSGEFQGRVRISKRGKPALRAALYQAAMVAVRHGAPFQLKYLRLIQGREQQPGVKRKALVAIGCKLLRIVYHVLKYEEPYRTMLVAQPNTMTEKCRSDNQVGESDAVFTTVRAGACV